MASVYTHTNTRTPFTLGLKDLIPAALILRVSLLWLVISKEIADPSSCAV